MWLDSKHVRDYVNTYVIEPVWTITNVKTLKDRLRHARELRGLSQQELAKKAHCSQSAIGNVESGERKTLRVLIEAARALQCSADWLYDGKGPPPVADAPYVGVERLATITAMSDRAEFTLSGWPFTIQLSRYDALPPTQKALIEAYMRGVIDGHEANKKSA